MNTWWPRANRTCKMVTERVEMFQMHVLVDTGDVEMIKTTNNTVYSCQGRDIDLVWFFFHSLVQCTFVSTLILKCNEGYLSYLKWIKHCEIHFNIRLCVLWNTLQYWTLCIVKYTLMLEFELKFLMFRGKVNLTSTILWNAL